YSNSIDYIQFMSSFFSFFFFTHPSTTQIYTLSLHDALPISVAGGIVVLLGDVDRRARTRNDTAQANNENCDNENEAPHTPVNWRSEEHTSELQSRFDLVCRLLLEKKKKK